MRVLGINGSLFCELWHEPVPAIPHRSYFEGNHDAAAVLLEDGKIVAAVEQERLDRIKHAGGFPVDAIRSCLAVAGCTLASVDLLAVSYSRAGLEGSLLRSNLHQSSQGMEGVQTDPERFMAEAIDRALSQSIDASKLRFVKHHFAHAASAFWPSGFGGALVATFDGGGEDESGLLALGDSEHLHVLQSFPPAQSLGQYYLSAIRLIGFRLFEEYKAMGLAPYGDPRVYRAAVSEFYELKAEGQYVLHLDRVPSLSAGFPIRTRRGPFKQPHMDFAAAVQEGLEKLVFHVLEHARARTGQGRLCFAGGVAHNCTLNGKLRTAGLFDDVFVQPSSHDAGLALGAALVAHQQAGGRRSAAMRHVYLGRHIGTVEAIEAECLAWSDFVTFHRSADITADAARLLADGEIIGWAQGRAEYGPRALGNRSILADPRPSENKEIINAMIKKREGFRPFAPAVVEEEAGRFFETGGRPAPFMSFALKVRPEKRAVLGAVSHIDGSARVQTVSREDNERFWSLIVQFGRLTGVPVVLNTSFNNHAEPIVDSARDSLVTFLTTGLHALVLGDVVVRRQPLAPERYGRLVPKLPASVCLSTTTHHSRSSGQVRTAEIRPLRSPAGTILAATSVSAAVHDVLQRADGTKTIMEILANVPGQTDDRAIIADFLQLWGARLIELYPRAR